MHDACSGGHLSVCKWLFEAGAAGDISKADTDGATPMHNSCGGGHLLICQWLFEVGAARDTSRVDSSGAIPMHSACSGGLLSVCQWLFKVGAAEDTSRVDNNGATPMHLACRYGYLSICQWLLEVGAAGTINRADNGGDTPLFGALFMNHLSVCQWLFLNGANIEIDGTKTRFYCSNNTRTALLPGLLKWAREKIAVSVAFMRTILVGALSPSKSWRLWKLGIFDDLTNANFKKTIADFAGVPYGKELRNVRKTLRASEPLEALVAQLDH